MENANIEELEKFYKKIPPKYLYKYYSFNKYTERIIVHNEIYFAKPLEFNDPFDSKPAISLEGLSDNIEVFIQSWTRRNQQIGQPLKGNISSKAIEEMDDHSQIVKKFYDSYLNSMGIFCIAEEKNNILMWPHYSDSYKGFCLEFESISEYFDCLPVNYENQRPSINMVNVPNNQKTLYDLLTKADLWEYEKEWRIIDVEKGPGIKTFPSQILTGIIMGYRIEERDRADLIKWCHERENKPKLYDARPNNKEFKVDIFEVSYPS